MDTSTSYGLYPLADRFTKSHFIVGKVLMVYPVATSKEGSEPIALGALIQFVLPCTGAWVQVELLGGAHHAGQGVVRKA